MPDHDLPLFVYGTLQAGHRNAHVNRGTRLGGRAETVQAFPLYITRSGCVPWLLHQPGQGLPVLGELYTVDGAALAGMDALERIDEPDWYTRERIEVRLDGGPPQPAWAYFGSPLRLQRLGVQAGPIAHYSLAVAQAHPFVFPAD
jgi:gamma-glutamylaminecyclotransferase